ncbi:MAG TPA: alkene reductase [Gemmatimonas sp.]|nr:alkene reductase [Gemmatimonas sp.]
MPRVPARLPVHHWQTHCSMTSAISSTSQTDSVASAKLFTPLTLGGLALPNRTVMAPMTRTRATADGVPTALMAEYYAQRASAGLIVTECTQVSDQGHGIIRAPGIHREDQVAGWRQVVDAVHSAGGRIYLQLWHCGRASHPSIRRNGELPVAPSAIAAAGEFFTPAGRQPLPVPRELDATEIPSIIEDFGRAAANAKRAGFDGVELHGAFGHLPDQFLQDGSNRRDDAWGGPVEHRARFMLEVVDAMAGAWAIERVGVKLSPSSRHYGMIDTDARATFGYVIRRLVERGVGYLHLMEPNAADRASSTVQIDEVAATFRPLAPDTLLIANGGFDRDRAEAVLDAGTADLVSFGVPFLANPDLPARLRAGIPLNAPHPATFYGEGPRGYTDYPTANRSIT